ncbi:tetratricopeptide repeat protein [bacterium]|nr:tetratricopeptide repeat protein [bacterium]
MSTLPRLLSGLSEVATLMRDRQWPQALERLEVLDRRYPNQAEILSALVNVCYELQDIRRYQHACERLLRIDPDNVDAALGLAGSYLKNIRPALALRAFRRFLDRWPDHERADEVRKTVAGLEAKMTAFLTEWGTPGAEGLEFAVLHEEAQSLMEQGKYSQARRVAEQLLHRRPDFAPALNNLSQIHFAEGHLDWAVAAAQQVLTFDPDNYHALSNLTRFLCLSGRLDEARQWAERLKAVQADVDAGDVWLKRAEALSFLGDDQGVLDAFSGAEQAGHLKSPRANPLLYHLAAVAAMRLGHEDEARKRWREALKRSPGLDLAQANLDDLRQPVGKRHAPWAFPLPNWVTQQAIHDMAAHLTPAVRHKRDQAVTQAARRYLRQHPEVAALVPLLLDRSDSHGREFALRVALMAETPEMLTALRDFALSQRGPDDLRHQAARAASEAGLLPAGPTRMWMNGEWQEILLLGFELNDEPVVEHKPKTERWIIDAMEALGQGDGERAERLLKRALEIEPDAPDLLNNLAFAYGLQGRAREAEALVQQVHQRHPDYAFARIGLARKCISKRQLDEARSLLEPLLSRKRFNFKEFSAFCHAQVELFSAEGKHEGVRAWLDLWAGVDPDNPHIADWRRRIDRHGLRLWPFGRRT